MSCKIRWDIPTNHPKNCRCTPCLSVSVFDKKPPMTAPIREALSQEDWNRIFMATGFTVLNAHMHKAGDAMKKVGEAARIAAGKMREASIDIPDLTDDEMDRLQERTLQKTGMSTMRGPN